MAHPMTRRSFCALSAAAVASLGLPLRAWADSEPPAPAATDSIVIIHTNDVHCAVDENLGYAKLVDYVRTARTTYGDNRVALVDAGDAVQGKAIGTLSKGEYLIDIMNQCDYDFAVPGNHEFDYGMPQFDTLVARSNARYLSCNFTDLRTGSLMFSPYEVHEYDTSAGKKRVAFVGVCTPESLTKSSPAHFKDDSGTTIYGFCEDGDGSALYASVQKAVDEARDAGKGNADYVVAVAHLGQSGVTERWRSTEVVAHTTGIDVLIDGHSHEEYVQTLPNKIGENVLVTQTGTQLVSIGAVAIDPVANTVAAATPNCSGVLVKEWAGSDSATAAVVAEKRAEIAKVTGQRIGRSDVRLVAFEDDGYTWAVRSHETNLGDFVSDAYRALAWHNGVMADVALVNGGGIRANVEPGDVTYGNIIDVQPFNNQLCYVETKGQNILDALEMGASNAPAMSGGFQHASGLTFVIRTDIPSSVKVELGMFVGVDGEYRVRDVKVDGEPLDVNKRYTLVSHTFMIIDGGDGMTMFQQDDPVLLDLDNAALIEYVQYDLKGVIGSEYAAEGGQGRIVLKGGPDPAPAPVPAPKPVPMPVPDTPASSDIRPLAAVGDTPGAAAALVVAAAGFAGAAAAGAAGRIRASERAREEAGRER